MFSRREVIEGAFERNFDDSNEEDILVGNDDNEAKFHHFGSLEDFGDEPLVSDDIQEESSEFSSNFDLFAVPYSRRRAFVMNSEDASSHTDDYTLAKIHEMAQEFEKNNLSGPRLIKK